MSTFKVPILLLVFNRPEQTALVFKKICDLKPAKLYIAADGARENQNGELEKCLESRYILNKIDWDCKVYTLFRETNLGCRVAVSSALDWFFDLEVEGIVLEDDCLPHADFFTFCEIMLEKYRYDTRIGHISGSNFQFGKHRGGDSSYYYSRLTHVWGWASWRRVWKGYDVDMKSFPTFKSSQKLGSISGYSEFYEYWLSNFESVYMKLVNTWDIQLSYHNLINNSLSIMPNVNLISNIGFTDDATHTKHKNHPFANIPLMALKEIKHPKFILQDLAADIYTLQNELGILREMKKPLPSRFWKNIKKIMRHK